MARGKYITDFEKECIRIGLAAGIKPATIARALGRNKAAITAHCKVISENLEAAQEPFPFVADDIADMLRRKGAVTSGVRK